MISAKSRQVDACLEDEREGLTFNTLDGAKWTEDAEHSQRLEIRYVGEEFKKAGNERGGLTQ